MSFEKIQSFKEKDAVHERSCIMIYHFTPAERKQLQLVAKMAGISDQIILEGTHGNCTLEAILENQMTPSETEILQQKTVVFNNISSTRMNAFIEGLKKCRIKRPLMATITETSIKWTLKELLLQLNEEHQAVKNNQFSGH